jgi:hypothetical protein
LVLLLPVVLIALMPLILIQRYRVGTARRMARPWMATFNVAMMALSAISFLASAAITAVWVPNALTGAAAGIAVGAGLGILGLVLTRWEPTAATLHYEAGVYGTTMILAFGIPQSLAAGGTVIGYYTAYAFGVRRRILAWRNRALRVL